jgi:hypothetical protein
MKNRDWLVYTYRHRRAFEAMARCLISDPELLRRMLERARVHDMDKMLLYLFLDQHSAQHLHVMTARHHLENDLPKSHEDLVETVIDYECAPYTKPDKPMNAYDFVLKLQEMKLLDAHMVGELIRIMHDLDIDHSGTAAFPQVAQGIPEAAQVTDEMLFSEILRYVTAVPEHELDAVLELIRKDAGEQI